MKILVEILSIIVFMIVGYYLINFLVSCFKKNYYQMYPNGPVLLSHYYPDYLDKMCMIAEASKLEEFRLIYSASSNKDRCGYICYEDNTEDQIDALLLFADFTVYGYRFNSDIGQLIPLEINFEKKRLDVIQREDTVLYLDNNYKDYKPEDRIRKCIMNYNRDLYLYFSYLRNIGFHDDSKKARYSIIGYILINNV